MGPVEVPPNGQHPESYYFVLCSACDIPVGLLGRQADSPSPYSNEHAYSNPKTIICSFADEDSTSGAWHFS